jgi:hypothetical protein
MLKLVAGSLLALSSLTAVAQKPSSSNACLVATEATTPLFTVEHRAINWSGDRSTKLDLVSNGAWTYTESINGKSLTSNVGCLPAADLATIKKALATATWRQTGPARPCVAIGLDVIHYSHLGKEKAQLKICGPTSFDPATRKALDTATAITAKLR